MKVASYIGKNFPAISIPEESGRTSHRIVVGDTSDAAVASSNIPAELRADQRFTVNMELRYSYRYAGLTWIGTGRTRNLSTSAVCFEIDQEVRAGGDLEVRIAWPSRLQHVCALELVLRGRIGRKGQNFAVLHLDNYEFETCGDRSFSALTSRGVTCNIAA